MTLNLTELFSSVQGETSYSGIPTTFIRLAACNLRCTWCDTAYSFGKGKPFSFEQIFEKIEKAGPRHICVTGGEPLLQSSLVPFLKLLCDRNYIVSLETGGSLPTKEVDPRVVVILDVKCPGSGMEEKNYWDNLLNLRPHDEVKFVLLNRGDFDYACKVCEKYQLFKRTPFPLFSPVHGILDPKLLVEWILADKLPVRLNLQQHKYIWSPTTRGV